MGALCAVVLTGCGGSGGPDVSSGQDVADAVGCTGFENDSEEMFVSEGGTCTLDGEEIQVYYFADNAARDNYVDVAKQFGANMLMGDHWVVSAESATLDKIKADIGGDRP